MSTFTHRAIGHVENEFNEPAPPEKIRAVESRIVLDLALTEGLKGLEPGQQVMVVFYFHRSRGYDLLQHPRGDGSRPRRGVFALRSPRRPTPSASPWPTCWPWRGISCGCGAWMPSTARRC